MRSTLSLCVRGTVEARRSRNRQPSDSASIGTGIIRLTPRRNGLSIRCYHPGTGSTFCSRQKRCLESIGLLENCCRLLGNWLGLGHGLSAGMVGALRLPGRPRPTTRCRASSLKCSSSSICSARKRMPIKPSSYYARLCACACQYHLCTHMAEPTLVTGTRAARLAAGTLR